MKKPETSEISITETIELNIKGTVIRLTRAERDELAKQLGLSDKVQFISYPVYVDRYLPSPVTPVNPYPWYQPNTCGGGITGTPFLGHIGDPPFSSGSGNQFDCGSQFQSLTYAG